MPPKEYEGPLPEGYERLAHLPQFKWHTVCQCVVGGDIAKHDEWCKKVVAS